MLEGRTSIEKFIEKGKSHDVAARPVLGHRSCGASEAGERCRRVVLDVAAKRVLVALSDTYIAVSKQAITCNMS